MLRGRSVTVVNCHSGRNVWWTYGVGRNVTWSVCGWAELQGTVKPVHFPLAAAHHPPSQAEKISGFLTLGTHLNVKSVVISKKEYYYIQGTIQLQKKPVPCSLFPYIE